jgi:dihydrofolate reductase
MVRFIAAIDEKRGIATDEGIPWDLPSDREFFRRQLHDGLIVMGAGVYRELQKPFDDRTNYVVTHQTAPLRPDFIAVHDVDAFFETHRGELIQNVGGASLYEQSLKFADELILTQLYADFHCTKFFPAYEQAFELVSHGETQTENGTSFRFETWRRQGGR